MVDRGGPGRRGEPAEVDRLPEPEPTGPVEVEERAVEGRALDVGEGRAEGLEVGRRARPAGEPGVGGADLRGEVARGRGVFARPAPGASGPSRAKARRRALTCLPLKRARLGTAPVRSARRPAAVRVA